MAQKQSKAQMQKEITEEEFEELLKEQNEYNTKKWSDLEINKIYTIVDYKTVNTNNGEGTILILKDNGEVWSPSHLATKIEDKEPPFYVRPLGLKTCKNNRKNKYHAYDLIFSKKNGKNIL